MPSIKLFSAISFALLFFSRSLFALPQFINEFHYDNIGGDRNEFVEIAGVAGSDLSGWSLEFYNGTTGGVYASMGLTGIITDETSGFGALGFSVSHPLQNGSKDGFALIDNGGQVVQFLSYEGVLTALSGSAVGLTSQDIGVAENSSTPVGHSLQLQGLGTNENDFSWIAAASSMGALNAGQQFLTPSQPPAPNTSFPAILPSNIPTQNVTSVDEPHALVLMLFGLVLLWLNFKNQGLKVNRLKGHSTLSA